MATIQTCKNFLPLGKQNGITSPPRLEVATTVSKVHTEQQQFSNGGIPRYPGLERYVILEKIGDGAFGNVYRARDSTGQYANGVAVKVVHKFEMNSNQRANILQEVQIMQRLDNPNIVKVIEFSESQQYYFIIIELCPGGELFHQIVRLTYFSEDLSRHVITQVAKALEYLHEEAGVVHRDIKPENLLFHPIEFVPRKNPRPKGLGDEDKVDEGEFIKGIGSGGIGVIKIADFGLSKVIRDSQTRTPCGTVGYTAPEIVKDERYSKSVDMWALGCVLYTVLCGFPPFYDESIQLATEKVARGEYAFISPWWDGISKSVQDLVSHLLTVEPERRCTIKQFLNHPWIRESSDEIAATEDGPPVATPMYQCRGENQSAHPIQPNPAYLESPSSNRRVGFCSPGAVRLREVFNVGYAVHRQQECKVRNNVKKSVHGDSATNSLDVLDEAERSGEEFGVESEPTELPNSQGADIYPIIQEMRNTTLNSAQLMSQPNRRYDQERGYGQHSPVVAAVARRQVRNGSGFELSLSNATLLRRRHNKDRSKNFGHDLQPYMDDTKL